MLALYHLTQPLPKLKERLPEQNANFMGLRFLRKLLHI